MSCSWDNLPDIVIEKVFEHLEEPADRFRASLVSKSWSRAFRSPRLWRQLKVEYDPDEPEAFDEKHVKFVSSLGQCLQRLNIHRSKKVVYVEPIVRRSSVKNNFQSFLQILTREKKPINLKKLSFCGLGVDQHWDDDHPKKQKEVVSLISEFIDMQSHLEYFDMAYCKAPVDVGLDFLTKLASKNSNSLKILNLECFFVLKDPVDVLSCLMYRDAMASFKNLVELFINYSFLDENILKKIVGSSFKAIEISCFGGKKMDHFISDATWGLVRETCPKLKVKFHITDMVPAVFFSTYSHLLIPPKMELHTFRVSCKERSEDLPVLDDLMSYLRLNFSETLVRLQLNFRNNLKYDYRILIELVSSCPNLKVFGFEGIRSVEVIAQDMRDLRKNGTIKLESCLIKKW